MFIPSEMEYTQGLLTQGHPTHVAVTSVQEVGRLIRLSVCASAPDKKSVECWDWILRLGLPNGILLLKLNFHSSEVILTITTVSALKTRLFSLE